MAEIACLRLRDAGRPQARVEFLIHANEQFDVGRKDFEREFGIPAPSISTHHLRFRAIVYDEDGVVHNEGDGNAIRVAPMIYVRVLSKNPARLTRYGRTTSLVVSAGDPDVLLDDGDVLDLAPNISVEFMAADYCAAQSDGLNATQEREIEFLKSQYHITKRRLGVGANASVFVAIQKRTQRQVACKIVPIPFANATAIESVQGDLRLTESEREAKLQRLEQLAQKRRADMHREYTILQGLDHPNIIALEKVLYTDCNVYIFQELVTGGDLMSYMDLKRVLEEPEAAVVVRHILKAVEYLHNNDIVHRDVKPENVLMTSWRHGARVVLTDFGQARTIEGAKATAKTPAVYRMQSLCGTLGYAAPEVFKLMKEEEPHLKGQGYSKAVDIWSVGCVTALVLTGQMLFPNQADIDKPQHSPPPPVSHHLKVIETAESWRPIGRKAKSFVRACVMEEENERLTAKKALLHEWFTNRHYAAELEAAYQRAIQDWKPRRERDKVIEFVDSNIATPITTQARDDQRSRHFFAAPPKPFKDSLLFGGKKNIKIVQPAVKPRSENTYRPDNETIEVPASPPLCAESFATQASTVVPDFTQLPDRAFGLGLVDWTQCSLPPPPPFTQYGRQGDSFPSPPE